MNTQDAIAMNVEIRTKEGGGEELWIDGKWKHSTMTRSIDGNHAAHIIALACSERGFAVSYTMREDTATAPDETRLLRCIFCEFAGDLSELKEHSSRCEKHPLMAEVQRLRARAADLEDALRPFADEDNWESCYAECIDQQVSAFVRDGVATLPPIKAAREALAQALDSYPQPATALDEVQPDRWVCPGCNGTFAREWGCHANDCPLNRITPTADYQRGVQSMADEVQRLKSIALQWNRAASEVGYCGSEYIDDPRRVFDRVKQTQQVQMEALCRKKREVQRLREALVKLRGYNEDIQDGRMNYRPWDHIAVIDTALKSTTPQPAPTPRIVVTKRWSDWHAAVEGTHKWGCGSTPHAAIGDVINSHGKDLGIDVQWPDEVRS